AAYQDRLYGGGDRARARAARQPTLHRFYRRLVLVALLEGVPDHVEHVETVRAVLDQLLHQEPQAVGVTDLALREEHAKLGHVLVVDYPDAFTHGLELARVEFGHATEPVHLYDR